MLLIRLLDLGLHHTEKIAAGSIFSFITGYSSNFLLSYTAAQRADILFYFQCCAYAISILVGLLAAVSYFYKFVCWIKKLFKK